VRALEVLAGRLREEGTPISEHVVDPADSAEFGLSDEYALVFEAVREGYLLHYGESRLMAGHDPDLGLLAGDYLYALGLDRLAASGDTEAVAVLSELIARCAQLHAEGREDEVEPLWDEASRRLTELSLDAGGSSPRQGRGRSANG
jgi:hypothetical protein